MPIVINELEVIIEEAPRKDRRTGRPDSRPKVETARTLRPADVLHIVAWQQRRMERLTAD